MKKALVLASLAIVIIIGAVGCGCPDKGARQLPEGKIPSHFTLHDNSAFPLDINIRIPGCDNCSSDYEASDHGWPCNHYYSIKGGLWIHNQTEYDTLLEAIRASSYTWDVRYYGAMHKGRPMFYPTLVNFSIKYANTNCFPVELDSFNVMGPFYKDGCKK